MESSSSESESCERVKNVDKALIKFKTDQQEEIESHAYKRRLGDLIFDANFESGNLGYVERVDQYEYDLMVRPDVSNPRCRVWFNFTVTNQRPDQQIIFTIVNFSEHIKLYHEGFTPVVRSRLNPNWIRIHEDQVFYYKSHNHGDSFVLSIAFKFSTYNDAHQFAFTYPYTYTCLENFVQRWRIEMKRVSLKRRRNRMESLRNQRKSPEMYLKDLKKAKKVSSEGETLRTRSSMGAASMSKPRSLLKNDDFSNGMDDYFSFDCVSLGSSLLSKIIYRLSVSTENKNSIGKVMKHRVIITCRSQGNLDACALMVCQGMIDFTLSDHALAKSIREFIEFDFVPMLNPDPIYIGNSQTDLLGQSNVSKKFLMANKKLYEGYYSFYKMIENLISAGNKRVVLIELMSNSNLIGSRIVGTHFEDSSRMERHLAFPRLMSRFSSNFYLEYCEFSRNTTWPTFVPSTFNRKKKTFRQPGADMYKMEISPFAAYKRSLSERSYDEYTKERYLTLGKATIYSLFEFLAPKARSVPESVANILEAFQPSAVDIDDLILKS